MWSSAEPTYKTMRILLLFVCILSAAPTLAQFAEPNEMGVRFAHMHLNVTDLDLHKELWVDLFDGVLVEREGYTAVLVPEAFIFLTEKVPTGPSSGTATDHFGFSVRDLDATVEKWSGMDLGDANETEAHGMPSTIITMPDGAALALHEDTALMTSAAMNHIYLLSQDPMHLAGWYADLFGAEIDTADETSISAHVPGVVLHFGESDDDLLPTDDTAIDHIGFEVQEMEPFAEVLRNKGIEFVFGPTYIESLELWVAFFVDPSGTFVEITEGLESF